MHLSMQAPFIACVQPKSIVTNHALNNRLQCTLGNMIDDSNETVLDGSFSKGSFLRSASQITPISIASSVAIRYFYMFYTHALTSCHRTDGLHWLPVWKQIGRA